MSLKSTVAGVNFAIHKKNPITELHVCLYVKGYKYGQFKYS